MCKMEQMPEPISKLDILPETAEEDLAADYFFNDEEDEDPACESNEAYNSLGQEEKESRYSDGYYDMIDAFKKELHKIVDDSHPAEWSYGMDLFITFIKFMKDFYHGGEGVFAMERKDEGIKKYRNEPTREETLTKAIEYYEKWMHIGDDLFRVIEHPETYEEALGDDGYYDIKDPGCHCEYRFKPNGKWMKSRPRLVIKWHRYIYKLEQKYKKKFFATVFKYLESWWD